MPLKDDVLKIKKSIENKLLRRQNRKSKNE